MGKLFKLALEEAVVEEPSIVENVPVEEAVQNAEELAKTDSEIQQDIAAVEELMEEKAKLEDQAVTNDELLSNPDAVVTATDVEVSEETRTEVQYSLGYTSSMDKIRLSQESIANDVRSNPRKYLAISNEDIKDTIKKIWEKIKAFFKKIWDKIKQFLNKLGMYKKIEDQKLSKLDAKISNIGNSNDKVTLAELKVNDNSVATEGALDGSFIAAQYAANPYLIACLLVDEKEFYKILDPKIYHKAVATAQGGVSKAYNFIRAGKNSFDNTKEVMQALVETWVGVQKNMPFCSAANNVGCFNKIIRIVNLNDMRKYSYSLGTSPVFGPETELIGVYSTKGDNISFIYRYTDENSTSAFGLVTCGVLPLESTPLAGLLGTRYLDINEVKHARDMLKNSGKTLVGDLDKIYKGQNQNLFNAVSEEAKKVYASVDDWNDDRYIRNLMTCCVELSHPKQVENYISSITSFRASALSILDSIINELETKNKIKQK